MTLKQLNRMRKLKSYIAILKEEIKQEQVSDTVRGSMPSFPYVERHTTITGYTSAGNEKLKKLATLQAEYIALERYIYSIEDIQLQYIFRLRFINCKSWQSIAMQIGGNNTVDSVKKMVYRYLSKQNER